MPSTTLSSTPVMSKDMTISDANTQLKLDVIDKVRNTLQELIGVDKVSNIAFNELIIKFS